MLFFLFYFVQPTENPRWKLWEHFCICKIIIVNRKVLQIWKLWPQFICLYFGISQFNWERREAIAVYFLSTNFLSIKVLINILKFPDDVTSSLCSSLWIHHPQVSIPGAIVSPSNPGIRGNMKDVRSDPSKEYSMMLKSFLSRSKYKCRKGEWKPDQPTCLSIRYHLLS